MYMYTYRCMVLPACVDVCAGPHMTLCMYMNHCIGSHPVYAATAQCNIYTCTDCTGTGVEELGGCM